MAKPIKTTPVLKGNDALIFLDKLKANKRNRGKNRSKLDIISQDASALRSIFKKPN